MKIKKPFSRRVTSFLLVCLLALTMIPTGALAADVTNEETHVHTEECSHEEASEVITVAIEETNKAKVDATAGTIGESLVAWSFDVSTGRLTITGSGDCAVFASADDQPWAAYRTQITEVWFNDMDALAISDLAYWFDGCPNLIMAEIPYTTPIIGVRAFANCPALKTVLIYHENEALSIDAEAFLITTPTSLEVQYVTSSTCTLNTLTSYQWRLDNRIPCYTDVYGIIPYATSTCYNCNVTCSYTIGYEQWSETYHCIRWWCSNCGLDMSQGTNAGIHTISNGVCTLCGYKQSSGEVDDTCYHTSTRTTWSGCNWYEHCRNCGELLDSGTSHGFTYTEWDGCEWYDYCRDCDELMDYGTSHGNYIYDDWEHYTNLHHRRYYYCSDCGEGSYTYGYHSTTTKYSSYSSTQHQVGNYCSDCDSYVVSPSYENHSFSYGSWTSFSSAQHRRSIACSTCDYFTYEYASHSLTYSSWANYSDFQHRRSTSCSCGYSSYEYANHSITYGDWKQSSATEHTRTMTCSCGFSDTESEAHEFIYGEWKSSSDTEHYRSKACDCGYASTETEPHDLIYSDWAIHSEEEHKRTVRCDCGYSSKEFGDHTDTDDDGSCNACDFMMTRFSVTVPASLSLAISKWGEVYAADNAEIVNNSTDAVEITGITLTAENGWSLVPYSTNMANAKVDAKQLGFRINKLENISTGMTEILAVGNGWTIAEGNTLPLDYNATISATSDPISEQVLTIVFIVDWAT